MKNSEYFQFISYLKDLRENIQEFASSYQAETKDLHLKELYDSLRVFSYNIRRFYSNNHEKADFIDTFRKEVYDFFSTKFQSSNLTIFRFVYNLHTTHFVDIFQEVFDKGKDFLEWEHDIVEYFKSDSNRFRRGNVNRLQRHQGKLDAFLNSSDDCDCLQPFSFIHVFTSILSLFNPKVKEEDWNKTITFNSEIITPIPNLSKYEEIEAFSYKYLTYYCYKQNMISLIYYIQKTDVLKELAKGLPQIENKLLRSPHSSFSQSQNDNLPISKPTIKKLPSASSNPPGARPSLPINPFANPQASDTSSCPFTINSNLQQRPSSMPYQINPSLAQNQNSAPSSAPYQINPSLLQNQNSAPSSVPFQVNANLGDKKPSSQILSKPVSLYPFGQNITFTQITRPYVQNNNTSATAPSLLPFKPNNAPPPPGNGSQPPSLLPFTPNNATSPGNAPQPPPLLPFTPNNATSPENAPQPPLVPFTPNSFTSSGNVTQNSSLLPHVDNHAVPRRSSPLFSFILNNATSPGNDSQPPSLLPFTPNNATPGNLAQKPSSQIATKPVSPYPFANNNNYNPSSENSSSKKNPNNNIFF